MNSDKATIVIILASLVLVLAGLWTYYGKIEQAGLIVNPTGTVTASVVAAADIALQGYTVNFGNVGGGITFSGIGNYSNATNFSLRNDGSVEVNVTVSATALFNSTSGNNSNYQFYVNNASGNTSMPFPCSQTPKTWVNMPLTSSTPALCRLNYSQGNDYAVVGIQITVPTGEAAGGKSSTVTFTASQGS